MQRLQHQAVAAERDHDIGLGRSGIAVALDELVERRLRFRVSLATKEIAPNRSVIACPGTAGPAVSQAGLTRPGARPRGHGRNKVPATQKAGLSPGLDAKRSGNRAQMAVLHCTGTISKPLPALAICPVAGKGA